MADLLPDPPPLEGRRWGGGSLEYVRFQVVTQRFIDSLESEYVVADCRLSFLETVDRAGRIQEINLKGHVTTANGGLLLVNNLLAVVSASPTTVQTREYSYHGRFTPGPRRKGQDVFRYDNCHGGLDTLHRHRFDTEGIQRGQDAVAIDVMPNLREVIQEVEFYAVYLRGLSAEANPP